MSEWFSMGGYAAFVWPAWGATALVLGTLIVWSWRDYTMAKAAAAKLDDA